MIGLDVADLIVIASEVLGCETGTALAQADLAAAGDALAQAGPAGRARSPGEVPTRAPGRCAAWGRAGRARIAPTPRRLRSS